MKQAIVPWALVLWLGAGVPGAGAFSADPPKADLAKDAPPALAAADEEFKPPQGFRKKTRGKLVVYCRREAPMGTRVKLESCYDENQMREYLLYLQQAKQDVDHIRGTCANVCVCGNPESCSSKGP
jgi:hypothetical protein